MPVKKILLPTDFSEPSQAAARYALGLCHHYGAELRVFHAVDMHEYTLYGDFSAMSGTDVGDEMITQAQKAMDKFLRAIGINEPAAGHNVVTADSVAHVIDKEAKKENCDLIVMTTHGRTGVGRFLMGSIAEQVVRTATCPVLTLSHVAHDVKIEKITNVMVPTDFSDVSDHAEDYAAELCRSWTASFNLTHVVDSSYLSLLPSQPNWTHDNTLRETIVEACDTETGSHAKKLSEKYDIPVNTHCAVERGNPANKIVELAEETKADLMVLGTHGRRGIEHLLLGSVAERVLRTAPCPVITIKNTDW